MRTVVSFPPHTLARHTVGSYNRVWFYCALPMAGAGICLYGLRAVLILALTTVAAVVAEWMANKVMSRPATCGDMHAVLIGFLVGLTLSPAVPWWVAVVASMTAVVLGKMLFGGLGFFPFHPVLVGWVVAYLSWPELMTTYIAPAPGALWPAAETAELPLALVRIDPSEVYTYGFKALFFGVYPGPIGASSALAIIIGGAALWIRGYLKWEIMAGFLIALAATSQIYAFINPDLYAPFWWHLFVGSALMTAFFLAPEPTTSPVTCRGMFLFGLGAGIITYMVRVYGIHPDGAFYGVLIFNALTPLLDSFRSKPLGRMSLG